MPQSRAVAPYPARLPVYPNRIGLILLGAVLGLGLSGIAVVLAESGDSRIRSVSDFPQFGDAHVLGIADANLRSALRSATELHAYALTQLISRRIERIGALRGRLARELTDRS